MCASGVKTEKVGSGRNLMCARFELAPEIMTSIVVSLGIQHLALPDM